MNQYSHVSRFTLGILGGTFDPPHYGHLALAETARVQLGLDRVLFAPVGEQPLKPGLIVTPAEQRAAMTELAIADNPAFALTRADLDRPGPHYTVDLLALLRAAQPEVAQWYFLLGEDSLADLPRWRDPAGILAQARLAVMPRLGRRADLSALQAQLPALAERLVWLDMPYLDIAATDLRRRARIGLPLRYLVPPAVEAYIHAHALYR